MSLPKLRFPEFKDKGEWVEEKLSNIADRITQRNKSNSVTRVLSNSAVDGVVDQRDYFEKDIANQDNLQNYFIVDKGDYVYNPRVSTTAPVGPISRNMIGKGLMSPLYTVFRFKDESNDFYEHFFRTNLWHKYLKLVSNTGARHDRMAISNDDFIGMPLPFPYPKEQQKIADCLSSLDDLIAAHNQKLAALKTQKKGLMQQLFPAEGKSVPKVRFPGFRDKGEWEENKLGNVSDLISGLHLTPEEYNHIQNGIPYFSGPSDYTNNKFENTKWTMKNGNTGNTGDILITVKGDGVGNLLFLEQNIVALGRQLMAIRSKQVISLLLYQVLLKKKSQFESLGSGNLIPGLSRAIILNLKVVIPNDKLEQLKIANCLSSLDDLIAAQTKKIEALKLHKKGLMQRLFPQGVEE